MFSTLVGFFKNKTIRNRIFYTLMIFFIFRFGAAVIVPKIDASQIGNVADNSFLGLVNLLGGGAIQQFSIFALGIGPYITASIIIQLLSMDVIPYLSELSKEGVNGKKKLDKYTRFLALFLALFQAYVMVYVFQHQYNILVDTSLLGYVYVTVILTAGTMFLMWLGDRITQHGIGNGISMIIFAGIVSRYPADFSAMYATLVSGSSQQELFSELMKVALFLGLYVLIILLVVFMHLAVRKIPIQYTSSSIAPNRKDMTYLPLKINSASVIPVIFASSVMIAPVAVANMMGANGGFANFLRTYLDFKSWYGVAIYLVLIVLFTFFYTNLQVDPEKIAENLSKSGTYIPGIRPGKETKEYLSKVLNRITVLGALFLLFVAGLPYIVPLLGFLPAELQSTFGISGTGMIIVVGVALETVNGLKGQLTQKSYRGFMSR